MFFETVEAAVRIRNHAQHIAFGEKFLQHVCDVLIHLKVMVRGPLLVDSARGVEHTWSAAAHVLDDRCRVVDKEAVVIKRLFDFVEDERCCRDGAVKSRGVD
jgi:hypothetical protein